MNFFEIDGRLRGKINPLNAKFTKWSNTLKQFVGKLPKNCLSVFDHLVGLAFKGSSWNFAQGHRNFFELEKFKIEDVQDGKNP